MSDPLKDMPYTKGIIDKIIEAVQKSSIEPIVSLANPEFIAGAEYQKKDILKRIKEIKF